MTRSRAWRRHQRKRAWKRAYNIIRIWYHEVPDRYGFDEAQRIEQANHMYKNRKRCSCVMCGHYRDLMGPPPQELRQSQNLPDEWFECIGCRPSKDCTWCGAVEDIESSLWMDIWELEDEGFYTASSELGVTSSILQKQIPKTPSSSL